MPNDNHFMFLKLFDRAIKFQSMFFHGFNSTLTEKKLSFNGIYLYEVMEMTYIILVTERQ